MSFLTASSAHAVLNIALLLSFDFKVCKILTKHVDKLDQTWSDKLDQTWSRLEQIRSNFERAILKEYALKKHVLTNKHVLRKYDLKKTWS